MAEVVEEGKRMVTLRSSDNELFQVEDAVVTSQSQTIKASIEEEDANADPSAKVIIPLLNVNSNTLALVVEYCKKHFGKDVEKDQELKDWDNKDFMGSLDHWSGRFDLLQAANYLEIKTLLDLCSQTIADLIKNKMPEEIREIFNIENDFTSEEEAAMRKENEWAFEV